MKEAKQQQQEDKTGKMFTRFIGIGGNGFHVQQPS